MKSAILFFAAIFYLAECNDIRLGYTQPQSRKIYSEIKEANPALWTRTDVVVVNAPNNDVISSISVTDLRDYKDGEAYIESGGIGEKSVSIGLKSPSVLRGYKFLIEVFANSPNSGYFSKGSQPYYQDTQYARKF